MEFETVFCFERLGISSHYLFNVMKACLALQGGGGVAPNATLQFLPFDVIYEETPDPAFTRTGVS